MHSILSSRLRILRENKNITQKQLADMLDIPRGTYAHYELGKRSPDHAMLLKVAEYFGVSTDYLLGRTEEGTPNAQFASGIYNIVEQIEKTLEDIMLSDDTKEIIKLIIKNDPLVKRERDGGS